MKVHFVTTYPTEWSYLPRFVELAKLDRFKLHCLVDGAEEADLILFVDARHEHGDWRFKSIVNSAIARRYSKKCFVYNETDQPWGFMPGIYVSMPKQWFDQKTMAAWSYIGLMNPYIVDSRELDRITEPDLLFSFSGRRCAPVRDSVLALAHPRAIIEDTSDYNFFGDPLHAPDVMETRRQEYAKLLRRSKFVLCPRGSGPASFRLFEALAAGRVPVILSDEWVAPSGPNWNACSLRIPESQASAIPAILSNSEANWHEMAKCALQTWHDWFAPNAQFHRMIEACANLEGRWKPGLFRQLVNMRRLWLEARLFKGRVRQAVRKFAK